MHGQITQFSPRMQPMSDIPTVAEERAAKVANLRERARCLDDVGPANEATILKTFDHPSWRELHAEERVQVDLVAGEALRFIFGVRSIDKITPRQAADLEQGATYLVRRLHPQFCQAAHEHAVETLLSSDEFKALSAGRSAAERRVMAHRMTGSIRAALHAVLEGTIPLKPAVYLRCVAGATEAGARE